VRDLEVRWNLYGQEKKYQFKGAFEHDIKLTIFPREISKDVGHVVVLPVYHNQLLFTRHKTRGIEWPGGKVEKDEQPLHAAIRELYEETGGHAVSLWLIGQYTVTGTDKNTFTKNIYAATISHIDCITCGEDTHGGILVSTYVDPLKEVGYSPLVQDLVFKRVREAVIR
jgi:8-oxo-dGTP diphosphatase